MNQCEFQQLSNRAKRVIALSSPGFAQAQAPNPQLKELAKIVDELCILCEKSLVAAKSA